MNQPLLILALLAALSCCQAAPAQQARDATAVQSTPGFSQLSVSNDHGSLMLVLGPDGQVTAVRDGAVLAPERVRREGDHLRIVDEAGVTLYDVRLLPDGGLAYPYEAKVASIGMSLRRYAPVAVPTWRFTPRKVIGVTVGAVDAVVASQLDLDPEAAFVISDVTEGLPAEKAGLKPHDVVVSIQGESPATVDKLREALEDKQPGDTVKLGLLRRGQRMDVDVGVAEESGSQVFAARDFVPGAEAWADFMTDDGQGAAYRDLARSLSDDAARQQAELEAAGDRLAELQEQYASATGELEQARQESASGDEAARAELKQRQIEVEMLRAQLSQQQDQLTSSSAAMRLLDLGGDSRVLMVPPNSSAFAGTAPAALPAEVDDRLRSMEERLARLEELLQKLVESDAAK